MENLGISEENMGPGQVITVFPMGGLGNQLFQYGIGLANATRLGTNLIADNRFISADLKRRFELDSFQSDIATLPSENKTKPLGRFSNLVSGSLGRSWATRDDTCIEADNLFRAEYLEIVDGQRLHGYFQSWKYLISIDQPLRSQLREIRKPSSWYFETESKLKALGKWTGIHVRRGDYLNLQHMGVLGPTYYEKSLDLLRTMSRDYPVVVFAESKEDSALFSESNLKEVGVPILAPPESRPIESLNLLSQATNLVIANSSFSWWAAWLAGKRAETVIAPTPWLDSYRFRSRDLLHPSWIRVSRESETEFLRFTEQVGVNPGKLPAI